MVEYSFLWQMESSSFIQEMAVSFIVILKRYQYYSINRYFSFILDGCWNTTTPHTLLLGSATNPISKLLNVNGKLWCSVQGTIKVMNSATLQVENQMQISPDIKPITNMAVYNNQVWISVQNSASIKCFHSKRCKNLKLIIN